MGVCNAKNSVENEEEISRGKRKKSKHQLDKGRKKTGKERKAKVQTDVNKEKEKPISTSARSPKSADSVSEDMKKKVDSIEDINKRLKVDLKEPSVESSSGEKLASTTKEEMKEENEVGNEIFSRSTEPTDTKLDEKIDTLSMKNEEEENEKPKFLVILSEKKEEIPEESKVVEEVFHYFGTQLQDYEKKNEGGLEEVIESLYNMGLAFSKSDSDEKALEYYDKAIFESKKKKDVSYDQIFFEKGTSYGKVGEFEKSLENFDEAIRISETNSTSYFNRAVTKTKIAISLFSGDDEDEKVRIRFLNEALEDCDKAIQICPSWFEEAVYNRSMLHLHGFKDYEKCIDGLILLLDHSYRKLMKLNEEKKDLNNEDEISYLEFVTNDYFQYHLPTDISFINDQILLICKTSKEFLSYPKDENPDGNKDAMAVENLLLIRSLLNCIFGKYRTAISDFRVASRLRNELPGVRNHFHSLILKTFLGKNYTQVRSKEEGKKVAGKKEEKEEEEEEEEGEDESTSLLESDLVEFSSVFPYGLSRYGDKKTLRIEKYLGENRLFSHCHHEFSGKSFSDFEIYRKVSNQRKSMNFTPSQGMTSCEYIIRIKDEEDHLISNTSQTSYRMNVLVQHGFGKEEMKMIMDRGRGKREDFGDVENVHLGTIDQHPIYARICQIDDYEKLEKFPLEEIDEEDETLITFFWNYESGRCLKNLILEREKVKEVSFTELEVLIIVREILRSVCFIHDRKMVHRNISEDTIFLDDAFGRLVLGCFGDCLFVSEYCEDEETPFRFVPDRYFKKGSNTSVLAPEILDCVLDGRNSIDYSKNDVFSVGLIGYRLLNRGGIGGLPFVGGKMKQFMYQDLSVKFSERIREFVKKMLFVDANQRLGCHEALKVCEEIIKERI